MPLRVLCLHGAQQTRDIFQNQLSRFQDNVADIAELVFLEAPHELPLLTAEDDAPTRSWCTTDGREDYSAGDVLVSKAMQPDGPGTVLTCAAMLGFSQGALMIYRYLYQHRNDAAVSAQLRGVIVAGAPDPRRALRGGTHLSALATSDFGPVDADCNDAPTLPLFGTLPMLHIIGKKDTMVSPDESAAFAEACSSSSRILFHEHAHSIPALKEVLTAMREMCQMALMSTLKVVAASEARAEELEMVRSMYDEDMVISRGGDVLVQIPLFTDVASALASSSSATSAVAQGFAVRRVLERIRLRFRVPWSYPSTLPTVELIDGPAWHSMRYERWAAEIVRRTSIYLSDELGADTAMLLPTFLYASGLAHEELHRLAEIIGGEVNDGARCSGSADEGEVQATTSKLPAIWEQEDETRREMYIAVAETHATQILFSSANGRRGAARLPWAAEGENDAEDSEERDAEAWEASASGGMTSVGGGGTCTLTIGLIGKPSAGKSTFFNAVTNPAEDCDAARVAAFPFTTIEPNIGSALAPLYCPCGSLRPCAQGRSGPDLSASARADEPPSTSAALSPDIAAGDCDALYGHVRAFGTGRFRRHLVKVKDVAGLVKGAYQGKGKGNQFLNDLCDADVLVHVVDGAAATEADGTACSPGQGSAMEDISWVRAEVHSWIYDNLRAKWESVVWQPAKLRTMLTGYRSTPSFVDRVLRRIGINHETALTAKLKAWGPQELHNFVALYIRLRFPMVVALNKADLPGASDVATALRQKYPSELLLPMSARAEWLALHLHHLGCIEYTSEGSLKETLSDAQVAMLDNDVQRDLQYVRSFFASGETQDPSRRMASTGVQDVLATAVEMCEVVQVFPVRAFFPVPSLAHCLTFKWGSNAERVFDALAHKKLLEGKLVRFEVVDLAFVKRQELLRLLGAHAACTHRSISESSPSTQRIQASSSPVRTIRKTEMIPSSVVLARILSNKRQLA